MTLLSDQVATWLVRFAGALSLSQIPAMLSAPRMLRWGDDLAAVSPLSRRIIKVIGLAIIIVVQGTGVVAMVGAADIAVGARVGVAFSGFLGAFYLFRTGAQRAYAPFWPRTRGGRLAHLGLSALFTTQCGIFLFAFVRGLLR